SGRNEKAAHSPVHAQKVATGSPKREEPLTSDENTLRPGPVAMGFFIRAGFYRHDMAHHRVAGEVNTQPAEPDATLRMIIELNRRQVGNEIDYTIFLFARLHFAAKEILLPGKTVLELMGHVEDNIRRVI